MDQPTWLAWAGSLLAALGGPKFLASLTERVSKDERVRRTIERDLELLAKIDWNSDQKKELQRSIDARLATLTALLNGRRDPTGIGLAIFFLAAGLWGLLLAWGSEEAWRWPVLVLSLLSLLFGAVGLGQDLPKRQRDEKGRPVGTP